MDAIPKLQPKYGPLSGHDYEVMKELCPISESELEALLAERGDRWPIAIAALERLRAALMYEREAPKVSPSPFEPLSSEERRVALSYIRIVLAGLGVHTDEEG